MIKLERILVPTDLSEFSQHAVRYGCEFARRFGAQLHLLTVVQDVVRTLVPALRLEHAGSCRHDNEIRVATPGKASPARGGVAVDGSDVVAPRNGDYGDLLAQAIMRKASTVCLEDFDTSKAEPGEKFETLVLPSGAWNDEEVAPPP